MKQLIIFALSFFIIILSYGQYSTAIQGNGIISTLTKSDIIEINSARNILINQILKDANNPKTFLNNLLQKDLQDARENGHNLGRDANIFYPKKITKSNFLTYYLNKSTSTRCTNTIKDTTFFNCKEQHQYDFLVIFPYIDGASHGENIESTQFLIHFEKIISWNLTNNRKQSQKTFRYYFSKPTPLVLSYGSLDMVRPIN